MRGRIGRVARDWRRRLVAAAVVAAVLIGVVPARAQVGATFSSDDALLLETRLGRYRLGEGVRGYATPGGTCLIFADVLVTLDLAIEVDTAAGTAKGWAFTEPNRIEVDRRAGTLRLGGKPVPFVPATIRDAPEGWCVDTAALASWLGVALTADQSNALLLVRSDTKLPLELAQERKSRAAAIRPRATIDPVTLPRVRLPYLLWRTPSLDAVVTVNGVRDRSREARTGNGLQTRYELFASGEALRMSVDARLASDIKGVPASLRARAYRTDPDGGLLGPLRATQVAVGDVAGFASPLVGLSLGGRGASVTNRPVDRPDSFDRTSFRGELPADWDAELYRNDQLLGFAQNRSDGRYEFLDVPLLYGRNRFEIVLYGPQGQIRRATQLVAVGPESIPTGKTYYWAGFSQDDRDLLQFHDPPLGQGRGWRGTVGVEHGLDPKTSIAVQLHTLMLRNERLTFVESAVRRAVGPALVEVSAAYERSGGVAARAQLLAQLGDTYVSAESIKGLRGFRSDRLDPGITGRHALSVDHAFAFGRTVIPTHLEARYVERRDGPSTLEAAARLSSSYRDFSLTAGLDWQSQRARGRDPPGSGNDRVTAALLGNGRVGRVRLRGEARYQLAGPQAGFEGATLIGEWGASDRAQWRAEVGYSGFAKRGRATVGYSRRFDRLALGASVEAATDGAIGAGLNLAFSVGPTPRGGVRLTSNKLGSTGSAIARVFRDLNEDGLRQANEPLERGVQLTAGSSTVGAPTNARGEAVIDELSPFRVTTIGIDTGSLPDPLIQPKTAGQRITPRPGVVMRLDIPLVGAGEIEGTLAANGNPVEGVDIELVDATGNIAATARSDFDGFFLFECVPYGGYTLRLAQLSADAARLASSLGITAKVGQTTPTVRLGTVSANTATLRAATN